MNIKRILVIFMSAILIGLGTLWLLQGLDIIHIKPILCFADCDVMSGKSSLWQVVGTITLIIGLVVVYINIKQK